MANEATAIAEELQRIAAESQNRRLTNPDEQRGAALFRDLVLAGGKSGSAALELLPKLPWFIPVTGTTDAWPQLSPTRKRSFLAALRTIDSEPGRRIRLSLARGLYRVDPDSSVKLLLTTLRLIGDPGAIGTRERHVFASVILGKNKPWVLQVDLSKLRPNDAEYLAEYVLGSCSSFGNPPVAMSIIQWAKSVSPLAILPENVQSELEQGMRRWSPRWLRELAKEELPPKLAEAVREELTKMEAPKNVEAPRKSEPHPSRSMQGAGHSPAKETRVQKSSHVRDLAPLFRPIEIRFAELKSELEEARNQLRKHRSPEQREVIVERSAAPSGDRTKALREENTRLAEDVAQLRRTLNELAEERFTEAVSRKADSGETVSDPTSQFKFYLQAQLREEIEKYQTVNRENHKDGVPLLLENILHVLEQNGIDLSKVETPPPSAKRRY
jgi:hypothetical protein